MNKKEQERENRQKNVNEYNSITKKGKPENQNQTHNVRKEGIQPINQKRWFYMKLTNKLPDYDIFL